MVSICKKKKGETLKFVNAGSNNWNETINNLEGVEKEEWKRKIKL